MKRFALAVSGAAALSLGLRLASAPANAHPIPLCGSGDFCIWEDVEWETNGDPINAYRYSGFDDDLHNDRYAHTNIVVGNTDSSRQNAGTTGGPSYVRVFDLKNRQGGVTICLARGTGWKSRSTQDRGSSFGWYYGC